MRTTTTKILIVAALCGIATTHAVAADSSLEGFLKHIASDDDNVRLEARLSASEHGASAIAPLADLMAHESINVQVAARSAIENIVYHTGRPGGVEERGEVCAALVSILDAKRPVAVRLDATYFLGTIAGDRSVPAIASLLDDGDPHVRETARLALERIPGVAAIAALTAAAKKADDDWKARFLYSLSKKSGDGIDETLASYAKAGAAGVRMAALEGLARRGAKDAIALFDGALAKPEGLSERLLNTRYLLLADVLSERVDREAAEGIYAKVLAGASADHLREHALVGLCPPGSSSRLEELVGALGDAADRVRARARRLLAKIEGKTAVAALESAFRGAGRAARPAVLRALAELDRAAAGDELEAATDSADSALKVTALDILGKLEQPALESTYLELAEKGADSIREIAIKGYLVLARARLATDRDAAYVMFERVLASLSAASTTQRVSAIDGIAATKNARGLELLARYFKDASLSSDAARGVFALTAALPEGKCEPAVPHLQAMIAGTFPSEIVREAVATLKELGHDPQKALKEQGFVVEWMLTTPIRNRGNDIDREYFPERLLAEGADMGFEEVHRIGPRRVRWRRLETVSQDGSIQLKPIFRRTERVLTYGYTEIESAKERDILVKMGSDDGIACWVNKDRVHSAGAPRGLVIDQDVVKAKLREGKNTLLVKVTNGDGDWAFSLRITDLEGKPIQVQE